MKKLATIINLSKTNLKNQKTGEIKQMCVITYLIQDETTENFIGSIPRTAYVPIKNFEDLKKYIIKPNMDLVYTSLATNNGEKYHLERFGDINLR